MSAHPAIHAAAWHGATADAWRERWAVPDLRIFRSVGSTNDVARALAEGGAPAGTVVLADEQTRGRGRRGRIWQDARGRSLLVSFVLRPDRAGTGVLPLRIGLAAARAIEAESDLDVGIKWPNDLAVGGRKLGGILCEASLEAGRTAFIIAGVGINVLQSEQDFPESIRGTAASIATAAGRTISIPALAGRLVAEVSMAAARDSDVLGAEELAALEARDILRGRDVQVDGLPAGRAEGVDETGALLLRRDGALHTVRTGTVRPENPA